MSSSTALITSVSSAFTTVNRTASVCSVNTEIGPQRLGDVVKAARLAKGLTQVELSEAVDMSQRWVSDVERGDTETPRPKTLRRLADVLGLDLAELFMIADMARTKAAARRMADETPREDTGVDVLLREARSLTPEGIRFLEEQIKVARRLYGEADSKGGSGTHAEADSGPGGPADPGTRSPRRRRSG